MTRERESPQGFFCHCGSSSRHRKDSSFVTARISLLCHRKGFSFLTARSFLFCHCEERSDEAVPYFSMRRRKVRLLRKRKDDLAVTSPSCHCEGQRPEAISQLRLLRRRHDDLAVTLFCASLRAKRSNPTVLFAVASEAKQSEIASPDEQTRLAMTPSSVIPSPFSSVIPSRKAARNL